jgi:hypothetical protein
VVERALALVLLCAGCSGDVVDILIPLDLAPPADVLPSLCSTAATALCDGFEGSSIDVPPWFPVEHSANVALDGQRAWRGRQSLHVTTHPRSDDPTAPGVRQGELTETSAVPLPDVYLRLWVYLPAPAPAAGWRLAGFLQDPLPVLGPSLIVQPGATLAYSDTYDHVAESAAPLPVERWFCLEWQMHLDAAAGQSHVWVDGQALAELDVSGATQPDPPVGRVSLGSLFFGDPPDSTEPVHELWLDEVIIDSRRVGCEH